MARIDFAPETGRTRTTGHRTKKAKRRAETRQRIHLSKLKESRRNRRGQIRTNAERIAAGWWPPTPLTGPPPVWSESDHH